MRDASSPATVQNLNLSVAARALIDSNLLCPAGMGAKNNQKMIGIPCAWSELLRCAQAACFVLSPGSAEEPRLLKLLDVREVLRRAVDLQAGRVGRPVSVHLDQVFELLLHLCLGVHRSGALSVL